MRSINIPAHGAAIVVSHGLKLVNPSGERLSFMLGSLDGREPEIEPAPPSIKHRHYEPNSLANREQED